MHDAREDVVMGLQDRRACRTPSRHTRTIEPREEPAGKIALQWLYFAMVRAVALFFNGARSGAPCCQGHDACVCVCVCYFLLFSRNALQGVVD